MTGKITKDTIYLDIDDEITSVIDKVVNSEHKIVALVLPKRATVFQSAVNIKLLKRAASAAKKNIALITSDKSVLPVAAMAGMMVAKTPSSKPSIPEALVYNQKDEAVEIEDIALGITDVDADKKIVESLDPEEEDEPIELDNEEVGTGSERVLEEVAKPKKSKIKIPNFSSFKIKLALAIAGSILIMFLWILGFVILPKATITLDTNISSIPLNSVITADAATDKLDLEKKIIPAERVQIEKINSAKVPATGEKNIGEKATGMVTLTNCINSGEDEIVPAGTRLSSGSIVFVTTETVKLDFAIFSGGPNSKCLSSDFGRDKDVGVVAEASGPDSNLSARSYSSSISGIKAYGSDMSGGTSEIIKVISQEDVDKAKTQLEGTSQGEALGELKKQLEAKNMKVLEPTFKGNEPKIDVSPAVGQEASELEVKSTVIYSLSGVNPDDLNALLNDLVNSELSEQDQQKNLLDNGFESVALQMSPDSTDQSIKLALTANAKVGPKIDIDKFRSELAGKKRGEIQKVLLEIDGVRNVEVRYSPGWITTTPKSAKKIEIIVNEQNGN